MKAYLKHYRQSPRKVRLVADMARGQSVAKARILFNFVGKRAAHILRKLLDSAVANASHNDSANEQNLVVREIRVDGGRTLKRYRPRARGSAHPIRKRTSNILLILGEQIETNSK